MLRLHRSARTSEARSRVAARLVVSADEPLGSPATTLAPTLGVGAPCDPVPGREVGGDRGKRWRSTRQHAGPPPAPRPAVASAAGTPIRASTTASRLYAEPPTSAPMPSAVPRSWSPWMTAAADPHPVPLLRRSVGPARACWPGTGQPGTRPVCAGIGPGGSGLLLRESRGHGRLLPPRCLHDRPLAGRLRRREAARAERAADGKGISRQAFSLKPKLHEVERWVRQTHHRVVEVHPEVSFTQLAGTPLTVSKLTWVGAECRRQLLAEATVRDLELTPLPPPAPANMRRYAA